MDRFCHAIAAARFLTMSLLLHLVIVIVGGGMVLFKAYRAAPDFIGSEEGILVSAETTPASPQPDPVVAPTIEPATPATANATSTPIDAIAFSGPAQFAIGHPALSPRGTGLESFKDKVAGAGAIVAGGTAMRMFGVQARASSIVFCVDVSGSMISGKKSVKTYEVVEREIAKVIQGLGEQTRFGLVVFSRDAKAYRRVLLRASGEEKQRVLNWLRRLSPEQVRDPKATPEEREFHHGTRADHGLAAAFEMQPDVIFFVSDGEPSGSTPPQILDQVQAAQKNLPKPATIHAFAYLADGGQKFMADLAKQNLGTYREINPGDVK